MAMNLWTQYLHSLDPTRLKKEIDLAVRSLRHLKFESIAFTGVSGALVAPAVAARLKKGLIVVRKDSSHSGMRVEGHRLYRTQKYIIIDDFPATGATVKRIMKAVPKNINPAADCVGVYFYSLYHVNTSRERSLAEWKGEFKVRVIPRKRGKVR